ncbi:hypothetical protein MHU86_16178 [Fragilaria crotonensis]|nr:hypothetical protein MHU86_16178 [Fragilaria crotonensis]
MFKYFSVLLSGKDRKLIDSAYSVATEHNTNRMGAGIPESEFDLEVKRIAGDGHCLFRAFAKSIDGDEGNFQYYRDMAANYLEKSPDLQASFTENESLEKYISSLRTNMWGGEREIRALEIQTRHQVKVFKGQKNNDQLEYSIVRRPSVDVEEGRAIIYLLFTDNGGTDEKAGHYDLLVKKTKAGPVLTSLIEKLKEQEQRLCDRQKELSERLQTSFLKKDIMDESVVNLGEVKVVLESIAEIARQENWFDDLNATMLIYDVLCDLQPLDVLGEPEENIFRRWKSPGVIVLHIFAYFVYLPVMTILMGLLLLARIQGWITLITGFLGAAVSAVSAASPNAPSWNTASNVLGIITGILAAAKGISLDKDGKTDHLYERVEDLTMEVVNRTFGSISDVGVFQGCCPSKSFDEFTMALRVKKADIRKVQNVRMFLKVVVSTSLAENGFNFIFIDKMSDVSKRVEAVLIDPYNNLTLRELEKNDYSENLAFTREHIRQIKKLHDNITPAKSFCSFLKSLNTQPLPVDKWAEEGEGSKKEKTSE